MKKKLKKWIFNYIIYGYLLSLLSINLYSYIEFCRFDFSLKIFLGCFLLGIAILILLSIYKYLFSEFIKTWKSNRIVGKILLVIGIGYVCIYTIAKILKVFNEN